MGVPFDAVVVSTDPPEFALRGELDVSTVERFHVVVDPLLDAADTLVLDLAGLKFCGSTGLSAFVGARRQVEELRLRSVPWRVLESIRATGLDRILTIEAATSGGTGAPHRFGPATPG
jgi:anti-sigma B factor antagonist